MTILTMTAGLLCVFVIHFLHWFGNGLAIGNPWSSHIRLNFEFTQQPVDNNIEMKFAHSPNNCLPCSFVGIHSESWVFFRQFAKGFTHLFLIGRTLWLNGNGNYGFRECNAFQNQCLGIAKSISCKAFFETQNCTNITGANVSHIFTMVGMHTDQATDTFLLAFRRILYCLSLTQDAGINANICQTTYIRVSNDFKY